MNKSEAIPLPDKKKDKIETKQETDQQPSKENNKIVVEKDAGIKAGHDPEKLKVGIHALGYVAETKEKAVEEFYPGYAASFTKIGRERGWPPVTRDHFESQIGPTGALVIGDVEEVAEKVLRHSDCLLYTSPSPRDS